jgi:pentatricopeptide repeat protein
MILRRLVSLILDVAWPRADATAVAHAAAVKAGHAVDVFLSNHLIVSYARSDFLEAARMLFDEMPRRNLVSWSSLISCCARAGRPELALELFARMEAGVRQNEYVLASVARSCAALRALAAGTQVHAHAVKSGFLGASSFVSNSITSMYMKCGCFDEGYDVFRTLAEPTVVSYNAVISGLAASSRPEKGLEAFRLMKLRGLRPDRFSYAAALGMCSDLGNPNIGAALHCDIAKIGLGVTAFVGNVILDMYSKHGTLAEAEQVFLSVEEKDAVTWNTYIAAHSRRGGHMEALQLFKDMLGTSIRPDNFTHASALAACAELSLIRHGRQVHCHLIRSREDTDVAVCNAIITMYARCGRMVSAARAFDQLRRPNLCSWNALISGFSKQGHAKEAMEAFERMKEAGIAPDSITFTGLLAACNHAGSVSQGVEYLRSMSGTYGVSPGAEHVSCVVDLLGRAGRLKEAEDHVLASAFRDDPVVLGSLLSASRVHGDTGVGERAAGRLLALGPAAATSSQYALLAHLHASGGRWAGAAEAWRMMLEGGAAARKKDAGRSVVDFG